MQRQRQHHNTTHFCLNNCASDFCSFNWRSLCLADNYNKILTIVSSCSAQMCREGYLAVKIMLQQCPKVFLFPRENFGEYVVITENRLLKQKRRHATVAIEKNSRNELAQMNTCIQILINKVT